MAFDPTPLYNGSFDGVGFSQQADESGRYASLGVRQRRELVLEYPGSDDVDYINLGEAPTEMTMRVLVTPDDHAALASRRNTTATLICAGGFFSGPATLIKIEAQPVAVLNVVEDTLVFRR